MSDAPQDERRDERGERIRTVVAEFLRRRAEGEELSAETLIRAHPELMPELEQELARLKPIAEARDAAEKTHQSDATVTGGGIHEPEAYVPGTSQASSDDFGGLQDRGEKLPLDGDDSTLAARFEGPLGKANHIAEAMPEIPDYTPLKMIGEGGFGRVWLAKEKLTGVFYALKTLAKSEIASVELAGVRAHKSRAAGHPHVVNLEHVGETADHFYYVMELADDACGPGRLSWEEYEPLTLDEQLKRSGSMTVDAAKDVIQQLLRGLEHLHKAGLLHRDIKPANVVRCRSRWKLGDMGLVARYSSDDLHGGTPAYSPPEGVIDRSGDLFSMGLLLTQLIAGKSPRRTVEPAAVLADSKTPDAARLSDVVGQACHPAPEKRFQTVAEMRAALNEALQSSGVFDEVTPRRRAGNRKIPPLLPYLANRADQDHALRDALRALRDRPMRCPLVCIIHGDEYQCEDMFLERLKHYSLPRFFKLAPTAGRIRDFLLRWSDTYRSHAELANTLQVNLAEQVLGDPEASKYDIALAMARERIPGIVHTHVLARDWKHGRQDVIRSFVEFWSDWPTLPRHADLIVCLFVKYESRGSATLLRRLFASARRDARIRRDLSELDFSKWPRIQGIVLPELLAVSRQDAEDWARSDARSLGFGQDLTSEIRNLYDRLAPKTQGGRMSMELLASELKTILSKQDISRSYTT